MEILSSSFNNATFVALVIVFLMGILLTVPIFKDEESLIIKTVTTSVISLIFCFIFSALAPIKTVYVKPLKAITSYQKLLNYSDTAKNYTGGLLVTTFDKEGNQENALFPCESTNAEFYLSANDTNIVIKQERTIFGSTMEESYLTINQWRREYTAPQSSRISSAIPLPPSDNYPIIAF